MCIKVDSDNTPLKGFDRDYLNECNVFESVLITGSNKYLLFFFIVSFMKHVHEPSGE